MADSMVKLKAVLVSILIFVAGFLAGIGSLAAYRYCNPSPLMFLRNPGRAMELFTQKLELTEQQRTAVEKIVRETQKDLGSLRDEIRPKIKTRLNQSQQAIAALLTGDQKEKFNELVERQKERMKKMEERREKWLENK